jgi:hypothetical protein
MSWFGFGGGDKKPEDSASRQSAYDDNNQFPGDPMAGQSMSSGSSATSGMGEVGGRSLDPFQKEVLQVQASMQTQMIVHKLTNLAFEGCITKPSSSLSSSERSCIASKVGKYFDTAEFVMRGLSGQ